MIWKTCGCGSTGFMPLCRAARKYFSRRMPNCRPWTSNRRSNREVDSPFISGVPLWFAARANCVNPGQSVDPRAKILYRIAETEVADENTGENVKTVLHRRVNARLLLENEDRSDLEVIPLLRVTGPQVKRSACRGAIRNLSVPASS